MNDNPDVKTIVVLRDVAVASTLHQGEIVQATEAQEEAWRLVEPERFAGNCLANNVEAEEVFTLQEAAAFLAAQWGKEVPINRAYGWRTEGKFPNAVAVPAHGHAGRRWLVPRSDLVQSAATHRYVAKGGKDE